MHRFSTVRLLSLIISYQMEKKQHEAGWKYISEKRKKKKRNQRVEVTGREVDINKKDSNGEEQWRVMYMADSGNEARTPEQICIFIAM